MAKVHDAWLARQRARWMRPNAHLCMRPDAHRFVQPDLQRRLRPDWKRCVQPGFEPVILSLLEGKANFNPSQPRVPKGNPDGGQWIDEGADEGSAVSESEGGGAGENAEVGAARRAPGFSRAKGHHPVPRAVFRKRAFPEETKKVFEETSTGPLRAGPHRWSREHDIYNEAVDKLLDKFLGEKGLTSEATRPEHAREFIDVVRRSRDPRIREFNLNILRRELNYIMRFGPRRPEQ